MIIIFEGNQGSGKSTTIQQLTDPKYCKFARKIQVYKSWQPNPPSFYNNGLCNKGFEDVLLSDFLHKISISKHILIFDRSLVSAYAYRYISKDETLHPDYVSTYFKNLYTGINKPVLLFHLSTDVELCRKRTIEKNKVFHDVSIEYNRFYDTYAEIIKKYTHYFGFLNSNKPHHIMNNIVFIEHKISDFIYGN